MVVTCFLINVFVNLRTAELDPDPVFPSLLFRLTPRFAYYCRKVRGFELPKPPFLEIPWMLEEVLFSPNPWVEQKENIVLPWLTLFAPTIPRLEVLLVESRKVYLVRSRKFRLHISHLSLTCLRCAG